MASEKLLKAFNDQYNFELLSGYYYIEMAGYCADENMNGFHHFFTEQSKEEYYHAVKMADFIFDMDGKIELQGIEKPEYNFTSYLDVFKEALEHEKEVTKRIKDLMKMAKEEDSYDAIEFLQWYIAEQREEENTFKDIIFKLEGINNNFQGLYMLDKELAARPAVDGQAILAE